MDTTIGSILVVIIFALIIIAGFVIYQRQKVKISGPFGTGLEIDGSNDPPPIQAAITGEEIKSRQGGLVADDQTGRGVAVKKVDVKSDVLLGSKDAGQASDPKAPPPA